MSEQVSSCRRRLFGWMPVLGLLAMVLLTGSASGEIIPTGRRINWSRGMVGVPGGIPNRTSIFCNVRVSIPGTNIVAKGDGIANDAPAIEAALRACPSNKVVFLPAGRYLAKSCLSIRSDGVTLRGEGMGKTVIIADTVNNCSGFFSMGTFRESPAAERAIISGFTKGSSNIVVSSAAGLTVDRTLLKIWQTNLPTVKHTGSTINMTRQMAKVVKIEGTKLTIWPPLVYDFTNKPTFKHHDLFLTHASGIEDLTISAASNVSAYLISLQQTYGCWLKGVETHKASAAHVFGFYTVLNEVRECYVHEAFSYGANSGAGIELYTHNTGFLIEDNIIESAFPSTMLSGSSSGCVVAYNYSHNPQSGSVLIGGDFNCNHGPHNVMNLYEGNVGSMLQSDGYFGSASEITAFRNFFSGSHPTLTLNQKAVDLCRWSRNFNIVGNVLGLPNWTGAYETFTNNYSYRVPTIYRLGYPGMANNGYTGTNPPSKDIMALDLGVAGTLLRHGNFDYATKKTNWDSKITDRVLPASLYHAAKPAWWPSDLRWPALGPDLQPMVALIPAQRRFFNSPDSEAPQRLRQVTSP
ncbi:MAG: hypothetical protein JNN07_07335 [Verrucomicrobiales bacterium]|nr:hypothetical protein [Verrucomicrobiales bacterium]